jgi:hypothetical protein
MDTLSDRLEKQKGDVRRILFQALYDDMARASIDCSQESRLTLLILAIDSAIDKLSEKPEQSGLQHPGELSCKPA